MMHEHVLLYPQQLKLILKSKSFICEIILYLSILLKTMETRPVVPDRKLLARLVLIREEARNMMGGGILDERNDRGLNTLPESEVCKPIICLSNKNMLTKHS